MTRRVWQWAGGLALLGLLDLGLSIQSRATWHPAGSHASATVGQVLGFVTSAVLLVAAALVLAGGLRVRREERRIAGWRRQAEEAQS